MVSLVPTMLHRLLERKPGNWPGRLRLILLGGAAASPDLQRRSAEINLPVAPTWGLTETTSQVATMLPATAQDKPGSVGRPLIFNRLRVVNESNDTLQSNQMGELLVSGPTVMPGYWCDEQETARALHGGELHTGDLGYLDEDGDLFIVQRRSDLIISGGENVYPAEVERVLCSHVAVQDAAVLGIADAEWGQRGGGGGAVAVRRDYIPGSPTGLLSNTPGQLQTSARNPLCSDAAAHSVGQSPSLRSGAALR